MSSTPSPPEQQLLDLLHQHPSLGNAKARELLQWSESQYEVVKANLVLQGLIIQGRGRGGSIKLAVNTSPEAADHLAAEPMDLQPMGPMGTRPPMPVHYPTTKRAMPAGRQGPGRPPLTSAKATASTKAKGPEATGLEAGGQEAQGPEPKTSRTTVTSKQKLEATLWDIANALRGKMSADDFRDYILGFIFFKYLSEKMELYADEILHPDGITYDEITPSTKDRAAYLKAVSELSVEHLGYFLEPEELFKNIVPSGEEAEGADAPFILDKLTKVLNRISDSTRGHESEDDFANLFEDLDLTSSKLGKGEKDKNNLVVKVLRKLATVDFELNDPAHDVLGDAYEYLIAQFASGAGKKAGEFYTPQEVSTVLARIVTTGKKRLKNVYDPTCGSGSLLLRVKREVLDPAGAGQAVGMMIYGQEMNPTTFNLCRMNMIMHDVHYRQFDVRNEDTLERPQHLEHRFEAIVANPPFSAHWKAGPTKSTDDRFSAPGKLAPQTKADFAFLLHMLHHLDEGGTLACVLPHGVLFRGAAEAHIREYLIRDLNVLDAVIGLPAQIFYGTGIPTSIVVLKKGRKRDDILFIDASQHYEKVKTQNKLRAEDVDRIVNTYRERSEQEKYSHVATLDEVKANGCNLNIPRYVDTFEAEEAVDLNAVAKELQALEQSMKETDATLAGYCKELGIVAPF
jgi:type I restriction enzyme M protein